MPHIKNVTQIKQGTPEGGRPDGINNEKKGSDKGIQASLSKSSEKKIKRLCSTNSPG